MSKNRAKTGLIHIKNKEVFNVSKEKSTGKLFIRGTNEEVSENQVKRNHSGSSNYDFNKPSQAQHLGDEWDDYAWSQSDY